MHPQPEFSQKFNNVVRRLTSFCNVINFQPIRGSEINAQRLDILSEPALQAVPAKMSKYLGKFIGHGLFGEKAKNLFQYSCNWYAETPLTSSES